MSNTWKLRILGLAAVALVVVGIVLVVTGGDDGPAGPSTTTSSPSDGEAPRATLPLDDTSVAGVSALAGLTVPDGVADFLSAATEDRTQLDVSFTLPEDRVGTFVAASGFPTLAEGDQVITHSSPLWKVNPEGTVSGAADTIEGAHGTVTRAVETVPDGGRVRVRLVITPAG